MLGLDASGQLRQADLVAPTRCRGCDGREELHAVSGKDHQAVLRQSRYFIAQKLSELVGDLYLAEGKKKKLWTAAEAAMKKLGVPQSRVDQIMKLENPAMLADLVKDLQGKK